MELTLNLSEYVSYSLIVATVLIVVLVTRLGKKQ